MDYFGIILLFSSVPGSLIAGIALDKLKKYK